MRQFRVVIPFSVSLPQIDISDDDTYYFETGEVIEVDSDNIYLTGRNREIQLSETEISDFLMPESEE